MRLCQISAQRRRLDCAVEPVWSRAGHINAMYAARQIAFDQNHVIAASVSLHKAFFRSRTVYEHFDFAPDPLVVPL